ncbi:unnamed protein product [Cochlearia groenlandica]
MDFSYLFFFCLTIFVASLGFFTLYKKFKSHQDNKDVDSSSSSLHPSSQSPLLVVSSLSKSCTHQVFPSFHGADVRKTFLSHILKEFTRKGIKPFIDNDIERSKSIGPKLIEAIRGSRIAVILLSRNYACSSWCLNELVEIMNCREELGQLVMTVFYEVDPTQVKKQTGDFGKVFRKTCKGKTKEEIGRWRHALSEVAQIAGYHSSHWDNEATMIEAITDDISNKLNNSTPSNDFDGLIGMGTHLENMGPLLCLSSDEVRMIGIWGPSGIGKTTIARFLFKQHADSFHLSVFMESIKETMFVRPICSDDYYTKLHLHKELMSRILHQKDIEVPHLGVAQDRLKDKRVLIILDDVDKSIQLDAMAKETFWFGPGSRIIITTQDKRILRTHGIKDIYHVDFPTLNEALQIFCMNAFGQYSPKDGFEELSWEVTRLTGKLPLGLKVMGSYFRQMSKSEWRNELPMLRNHLDGEIESILKFSYEALNSETQDLFLHIACLFNFERIEQVEELLIKRFRDVRRQLRILGDKSFIDMGDGWIKMHSVVEQLGREIVRKQSIHEPGEREFLVDASDVSEFLAYTSGSRNVIGINLDEIDEQLTINDKVFEGMNNLQFLILDNANIDMPQGINNLSQKLRLLEWTYFPMTCLPSKFQTNFLVKLVMRCSKLEKLWEGIRPLKNLMWMDLSDSEKLIELPDLSTATNLQELDLSGCSSLLTLPSSIGNVVNLKELRLEGSSLVELPSSIENLHKLHLNFVNCFKLNKESENLIITSSSSTSRNVILPALEVPSYFINRTLGSSLTIKLNEMDFPQSLRFKACVLIVNEVENDDGEREALWLTSRIMGENNRVVSLDPMVTNHIYIFELEANTTYNEVLFEFDLKRDFSWSNKWKIRECGVVLLTH